MDIPHEKEVQDLVNSINESQRMSLNRDDYLFIGVIVGLQITRQWINRNKILNYKRFSNDQEAAEKIKHNTFMKNHIEKRDYGTWILGPTTYDAISRSTSYWKKTSISGINHRYTVLAHDPLVGLVVGPVNLISNTITYNINGIRTSRVVPNFPGNPATGYSISTPTDFSKAFFDTIFIIKDDPDFLKAAILKHLIHLASDINTTQGLVIPGLSLLPNINSINSNEINKWLLKNHFDAIWFGDLLLQGTMAELINYICSIMYKFLLYRNTEETEEFVDAKCKKIIAIGNAISVTEDLSLSVIKAVNGNTVSAIKDLDWGGLVVAIKKIVDSKEFQNEIKTTGHYWDDIKYGQEHSYEDIENEFQNSVNDLNSKYISILKNMELEYKKYNQFEIAASNLKQSGKESFEASVTFANENNVTDYLTDKKGMNNFFNN